MESLQDFVQRFTKAIGCYFHLTQSGIYSIKKLDHDFSRDRNVFAWVSNLKTKDQFKIDTYKDLAEKANVEYLADGEKKRLNWNETGYIFYVKKGSLGEDFKKAVEALNAIKEQIH